MAALVAMEPTNRPGERALRDARVAALRTLQPPAAHAMATQTRRARYTAGRLFTDAGNVRGPVPAYADEEGVDPARGTETFAEVMLTSHSPRWQGCPSCCAPERG